jgi:hypothetical protein
VLIIQNHGQQGMQLIFLKQIETQDPPGKTGIDQIIAHFTIGGADMGQHALDDLRLIILFDGWKYFARLLAAFLSVVFHSA